MSAGSLIGAMHDRASVNNVAMRTVSIVYPDVLDIVLSHNGSCGGNVCDPYSR